MKKSVVALSLLVSILFLSTGYAQVPAAGISLQDWVTARLVTRNSDIEVLFRATPPAVVAKGQRIITGYSSGIGMNEEHDGF